MLLVLVLVVVQGGCGSGGDLVHALRQDWRPARLADPLQQHRQAVGPRNQASSGGVEGVRGMLCSGWTREWVRSPVLGVKLPECQCSFLVLCKGCCLALTLFHPQRLIPNSPALLSYPFLTQLLTPLLTKRSSHPLLQHAVA